MANHKSAIKRAIQSEARRLRNKSRKTRMKTAVKKLEEAMASNAAELAAQLKETISVIDRTASKGVIHRNNAARKISRLTRKANTVLAGQSA